MMWACARLVPRREALALHCLALAGFATYLPRIKERHTIRGRRVDATAPLFPGYAFVAVELQWHDARWCPGVITLVMDGERPARVPDKVIGDIRSRERNGLVVLPPPRRMKPGGRIRITRGLFAGRPGLYLGQTSRERLLVLLSVLGASRQVALPAADVEAVS
jgi:transcriptional antiterminator RfaH